MVNFGLLTAEICWRVCGTTANFNGFRVLAALLHSTLVVGVSQTLRCWTEGATYTVSHKKWSQLIFVCNFVKSTDFNAVFTIVINDERYMWWYKLRPPHLINVATIPCESQNSENVILPKKIASNVSCMLHRNGPVDYKITTIHSTAPIPLIAWQSFCTTSLQVLFGLPLGLEPSTSYSIHFFIQLVSSFHNTCPYHHSLFCCSTKIISFLIGSRG